MRQSGLVKSTIITGCFSRFGNLLQTAEALVGRSESGYSAAELKNILNVKTRRINLQMKAIGRFLLSTGIVVDSA